MTLKTVQRLLSKLLRRPSAAVGLALWQAVLASFFRFHGLKMAAIYVPAWHRLPAAWLQGSQVFSSLWVLHMQPPMFNVLYALILRFPKSWQEPIAWLLYQIMGWHILVLGYKTLRRMHIPAWFAFLGMMAWSVYPEYLSMVHMFSYTLPVIWGLAFLMWSIAEAPRWIGWALTWLGLWRPTYGLPFLALFLGWAVYRKRARPRDLWPLLLVGLWIAKNGILFGVWGTSSWFGMNWIRNVRALYLGQPRFQRFLIEQQGVDPIILYDPFRAITEYPESYWKAASQSCHGPEALCSPTRPDGVEINRNFVGYIPISNAFARAALRIWMHNPGLMLKIERELALDILLSPGYYITTVAPDLYPFLKPLLSWRDGLLCPNTTFRLHTFPQPPWRGFLCPGYVWIYLGVLIAGFTSIILSYLKRQPTLPVQEALLLTISYGVAVYTFFEIGENARMRIEIDLLWWLLALWVTKYMLSSISQKFVYRLL